MCGLGITEQGLTSHHLGPWSSPAMLAVTWSMFLQVSTVEEEAAYNARLTKDKVIGSSYLDRNS